MIPPVKDNRLRRNKAFESTEVGIGLVSFDLTQGVPQDNVIRRNEVNDSQINGIHIFDGEDNAVVETRLRGAKPASMRWTTLRALRRREQPTGGVIMTAIHHCSTGCASRRYQLIAVAQQDSVCHEMASWFHDKYASPS